MYDANTRTIRRPATAFDHWCRLEQVRQTGLLPPWAPLPLVLPSPCHDEGSTAVLHPSSSSSSSLRVRFQIIGNTHIENVGKYQSCMVSKLPIMWKQTVDVDAASTAASAVEAPLFAAMLAGLTCSKLVVVASCASVFAICVY